MRLVRFLKTTSSILGMGVFAIYSSSTIADIDYYKVPPSTSTRHHVPVISDEAMRDCVILYNQAERLEKEINNTHVNSYDRNSVDSYNEKVARYGHMIDRFNTGCAGKQSASAYREAQKLNNKNK